MHDRNQMDVQLEHYYFEPFSIAVSLLFKIGGHQYNIIACVLDLRERGEGMGGRTFERSLVMTGLSSYFANRMKLHISISVTYNNLRKRRVTHNTIESRSL